MSDAAQPSSDGPSYYIPSGECVIRSGCSRVEHLHTLPSEAREIVEQLLMWPGARYLRDTRRSSRLALYQEACRARRRLIPARMLFGSMWAMGIE